MREAGFRRKSSPPPSPFLHLSPSEVHLSNGVTLSLGRLIGMESSSVPLLSSLTFFAAFVRFVWTSRALTPSAALPFVSTLTSGNFVGREGILGLWNVGEQEEGGGTGKGNGGYLEIGLNNRKGCDCRSIDQGGVRPRPPRLPSLGNCRLPLARSFRTGYWRR